MDQFKHLFVNYFSYFGTGDKSLKLSVCLLYVLLKRKIDNFTGQQRAHCNLMNEDARNIIDEPDAGWEESVADNLDEDGDDVNEKTFKKTFKSQCMRSKILNLFKPKTVS